MQNFYFSIFPHLKINFHFLTWLLNISSFQNMRYLISTVLRCGFGRIFTPTLYNGPPQFSLYSGGPGKHNLSEALVHTTSKYDKLRSPFVQISVNFFMPENQNFLLRVLIQKCGKNAQYLTKILNFLVIFCKKTHLLVCDPCGEFSKV